MYGAAMEWLNFHHLRYFWVVARKGGVGKAAAELHVSQPSVSAQLKLLEESLGEKLFKRSGRNLVLTETGRLVLSYADEIFSTGRELMNAVKQRPTSRALRLNVGMTDALSKLIAFEILKPAFHFRQPTHVVCRQAELGPLVLQLQAHRLDIVLADEPAWPVFLREVTQFLAPDRVTALPAAADDVASMLSARELDVLNLAAEGLDNDAIAARLVLSVRTVERHLQNTYAKLGLQGRTARAAAVGRLLARA